MKVIGYIRVSTQGQARDGYSLAYQEDEIKAYCQAQGYTLLRLFKDEGISGAKVDSINHWLCQYKHDCRYQHYSKCKRLH